MTFPLAESLFGQAQLQASLPAGLLIYHPSVIRNPSSFGVCLRLSRVFTARPCGNQ